MGKQTYKVLCDEIRQSNQGAQVRMVIEAEPIPGGPGKAPERVATTIIIFQYADPKEATKYEHGKQYSITIE